MDFPMWEKLFRSPLIRSACPSETIVNFRGVEDVLTEAYFLRGNGPASGPPSRVLRPDRRPQTRRSHESLSIPHGDVRLRRHDVSHQCGPCSEFHLLREVHLEPR